MINKYLGKKYEIGNWDCVTLVTQFYKNEYNVDLTLPPYSSSRDIFSWTTDSFYKHVEVDFRKIPLTEGQDHDIVVCATSRGRLFHFGILLMPCDFLHLEENHVSRISTITDYKDKIYCLLRKRMIT